MSHKSRAWCMTINNYKDDDITNLEKDIYQYLLYGKEVGEKEKTPHLQIFIYYKNALTFTRMKNKFPNAHIEKCINIKASIKYCQKDNNFKELGTKPEQGKRTDLELIKDGIKNQLPFKQLLEHANNYQTLKYLENRYKYVENTKIRNVTVNWYYGKAGTGKTKTAFEAATKDGDFFIANSNIKWWDGYTDEKHVIIDDLRSHDICYNHLLKLLDIYPTRVEVKGGFMPFLATHIWITSNKPPDFFGTEEEAAQLIRRCSIIKEFKNDTEVDGNTSVDFSSL